MPNVQHVTTTIGWMVLPVHIIRPVLLDKVLKTTIPHQIQTPNVKFAQAIPVTIMRMTNPHVETILDVHQTLNFIHGLPVVTYVLHVVLIHRRSVTIQHHVRVTLDIGIMMVPVQH